MPYCLTITFIFAIMQIDNDQDPLVHNVLF